jgi:hypothetical protein
MGTCEIGDPGATYSSLAMFKADQMGAATGYCSLIYDLQSPSIAGFWTFELNKATNISVATYNETGSAYDKSTRKLTCTKF